MNRGRLNVYVSKELANWYRDRAKKVGISLSPMVSVALSSYKEMIEALDVENYLISKKKQMEILDVANQIINKRCELKDK